MVLLRRGLKNKIQAPFNLIMLTGITLENFKAFKKPQFIPIKPITLVYGQNSAGKSSIVHALAFLQHFFENPGACDPITQRVGWETFDLGGWNNLVYNHDNDATMKIGLQFSNCSALWCFEKIVTGPRLSRFSAQLNRDDDPLLDDSRETPKSNKISADWENGRMLLSSNHPVIRSASKNIWQFLCTGRSWESPESANASPVISYDIFLSIVTEYLAGTPPNFSTSGFLPSYRPDADEEEIFGQESPFGQSDIRNARVEVLNQLSKGENSSEAFECFFKKIDWSHLLTDSTFEILDKECKELFGSRIHLGPTRTPPNREINISIPSHEPWRVVLENKHIRKSVNSSLHELDIPYLLEVACKREIHYKPGIDPNTVQLNNLTQDSIERIQDSKSLSFVNKSGVSLAHCDLGYGISTTLPILVAIHTSMGKCISIEQPELHIHPRLQTVLGDLFIRASLSGSDEEDFDYENHIYHDPRDNNLFLIETHSEHLILRILRRIRETTEKEFHDYWPNALKDACPDGIKPEDIAVLYVEPGDDGAKVIELPVTPQGGFSRPWPGGFFEEQLKELG